jgi:hypothetical protein
MLLWIIRDIWKLAGSLTTHGYADFCHKFLISTENIAGPPEHYEKVDMIGIKI